MFSYRKNGGIHFVRLFQFGFTFYVTDKPVHKPAEPTPIISADRIRLATRGELIAVDYFAR